MIYGREKTKFILSITTPVISNSTEWFIEDSFLDNSDNSTNVTDNYDVPQYKVFESKGTKNIKAVTKFDDGWGNIFNHQTNLTVDVNVYNEPELDFSWTPNEPTIVDNVSFIQEHDDTRNESKTFGKILSSKIDYYNDNYYIDNGDKNSVFIFIYQEKIPEIPVNISVVYWDGFENQEANIIKKLSMSNVPPVSDWIREDKGVCVPSFNWFATSYDIDGDIDDLGYQWSLYQKVEDIWNLVDVFVGKDYSYPFQYESTYKIELITSDAEGDINKKEEVFNVRFKTCDGSGSQDGMSGAVRIQLGGFQLIAVPVNLKVSDLVQIIADKCNLLPEEIVEVCNSAPGIGEDIGIMYNYVPGVTNINSSNNFDLIMKDGNISEITGFWIKTKEHATLSYVDINWDSEGGLS